MKLTRKLAVMVGVLAMSASSWGALIGVTDQVQGPGGASPANEANNLLTLITLDEDCELVHIYRDDAGGKGTSHTYDDLDFLGDLSLYDTIYVGVKGALQTAWYEYLPADLPLTYSSEALTNPGGQTPDISHIDWFGVICPDVPDAGSMLVMLGAGMLGLAGLSRKFRH